MAALDDDAEATPSSALGVLHRVAARRGLKLRAEPSLTSPAVGLVPFGAAVWVAVDAAVVLGTKTRVRCTPLGAGYAAGWASQGAKLLVPDDDRDGSRALARLRSCARGDAAATADVVGDACVAAVCKGDRLVEICEELAARASAADAVGVLCVSALAFVSSARSAFRVVCEEPERRPASTAVVTVVVLGFGGSSLPELQSVVDFYAASHGGWRRVVAVTPAFPPPILEAAADAQIQEIVDRCAGSHHVLCHVFSNNGASALGRLIDASDAFAKRLRAVCFDSAADMHGDEDMMIDAIGGMVKNLWARTSKGGGLDRAKAVNAPGFTAAVKAIVEADDRRVLRAQTTGLEELCSNLPPYCRYLFVHSTEDSLIRKASIDDFIVLAKCFASLPIETVVFDKSPHCRHFDVHRDAYVAALDAFFDAALANAPRGSPLS